MIRAILLTAVLLLALPAHAQDNNPFSGATSIRAVMVRDRPVNGGIYKRRAVNAGIYRGSGKAGFNVRISSKPN